MEFTKYELYSLLNQPGPLWLEQADFSEADLFKVDLTEATLGDANFTKTNLSLAILTDTFLFGANLTGADLSDANLTGADLTEADLSEAILKGAIYDNDTRWPDDINPEALGAVLVTSRKNLSTRNTLQSTSPLPSSRTKRRKKINYIDTEEKLLGAGHGFEFHYRSLTNDKGEFPSGEPVALLELDGWLNNKSKPIHVRIHPQSSPKLKGMDEKPDVIIAQMKVAIELYLRIRSPMEGQFTEHIWVWVNA